MLPQEIAFLIAGMLVGVIALWALPSCGEPGCLDSHRKHIVAARAENIEKTHRTWHDPQSRPTLDCALCAAYRKECKECGGRGGTCRPDCACATCLRA